MLKRIFKMSFWMWYDHLGWWVILNVFCILPLVWIFSGVLQLLNNDNAFLLYLSLLGVAFYFFLSQSFVSTCAIIILNKVHSLRKLLFFILKNTLLKSFPVIIVFFLLFGMVFLYIYYSLVIFSFTSWGLSMFMVSIGLWTLIFTLVAFLWVIPSLGFKQMSWIRYVGWGFMVFLANPSFSFIIFLCYTTLCLLNLFPLFSFFVGIVYPALFLTCSYEILSRKYEAIRNKCDLNDLSSVFHDYEDEYLNRSWEHLLRPWKM